MKFILMIVFVISIPAQAGQGLTDFKTSFDPISALPYSGSMKDVREDRTSSTSHGGSSGVGGGGRGMICRDPRGKIISARLLDFDEAENDPHHPLKIDLGPKNLSVEKKIKLVLKRLEPLSPRRAAWYWEMAKSFKSESEPLKKGRTLELIDDSYHESVAKGCAAEQIVRQVEPESVDEDEDENEDEVAGKSKDQGEKRYTYNPELVQALSNDDLAGLILHEIIYREARNQVFNPHVNSIGSRKFNSLICSTEISKMTPKKLAEFLAKKDVDFEIAELDGIEFSLDYPPLDKDGKRAPNLVKTFPEFYDDGKVQSGMVADGSMIELFGAPARIYGHVEMYENGKFAAVRLAQPLGIKIAQDPLIAASKFELPDYINIDLDRVDLRVNLRLYRSGALQAGYFVDSFLANVFSALDNLKSKEKVKAQNPFGEFSDLKHYRIVLSSNHPTYFHENGTYSSAVADIGDVQVGGQVIVLAKESRFTTYSNGQIRSMTQADGTKHYFDPQGNSATQEDLEANQNLHTIMALWPNLDSFDQEISKNK